MSKRLRVVMYTLPGDVEILPFAFGEGITKKFCNEVCFVLAYHACLSIAPQNPYAYSP